MTNYDPGWRWTNSSQGSREDPPPRPPDSPEHEHENLEGRVRRLEARAADQDWQDRSRVPGAVTAVSVFLWIAVALNAFSVVIFLVAAGSGGGPGYLLLALLSAGEGVLEGICAVMIRHASRPWRNVTIVLLLVNILSGLVEALAGKTSFLGWVIGAAVVVLMIWLLTGAESSRRFFEGY